MELINKLLYRRFSKEQYKQIHKIFSEENKILLKRPTYIIGNIITVAMVFYFLFRAIWPKTFHWPRTADIVGITFGTAAGVLAVYLLLKLLKAQMANLKLFMIFFFIYMLLFGLVAIQQLETKWEYFIYGVLILVGWGCSCGSLQKHFCEKIFTLNKSSESLTDDGSTKGPK